MAETSEANAVNDDKGLMRFEWFQVLVRLAIAKYVHAGEGRGARARGAMKIADVSEALEHLLTHDVEPSLPAEAKVVPDAFRERRLYTKPMHDALERNELMLRGAPLRGLPRRLLATTLSPTHHTASLPSRLPHGSSPVACTFPHSHL